MSNITLFSSGAAIPDFLRDVNDQTLKDITGGTGGKQISIKGGVWRMIVGGEEVSKNEDRAMNFIIVAASKGVSRTFYEGKYEEGANVKPSCWSAEGTVPNQEVLNPQSANCATCRQNIEGSGEGKSRACRFLPSRTLGVPKVTRCPCKRMVSSCLAMACPSRVWLRKLVLIRAKLCQL
jgi:hypothetical protein